MVTGTSKSHQRVQPSSLLKSLWLFPPPPLLAAFDEIADPILRRVDGLRREIDALGKLRDILLPKLISGELRIVGAENRIAAA
jgi:type I restriction enzyme S subunit